MSKWIKKGDRVVVIAGNDKGKVSAVISREGEKVTIQGVNVRKKHMKSRQKGVPSKIIDIEKPIHISNISICDDDGKAVKIKVRVNDQGQRELFYFQGSKEVLHRDIRKSDKS